MEKKRYFKKKTLNITKELEKKKNIPQRFQWLLKLIEICYEKENFSGTIIEFERNILNKTRNGNFRNYFQYLIVSEIVKEFREIRIHGRKFPTFSINKERLIKEIESYGYFKEIVNYIKIYSPNIGIVEESILKKSKKSK